MPECCAKCQLYDDRWDYPTCYATQESRGYNFKIYEKRMPKCPLREKEEEIDFIQKHKKIAEVQITLPEGT